MVEIVNIDALPLEAFEEGTLFAAETASIGRPLGLLALGASLHVVQPGKSACPFHRHHGTDELFMILSGSGDYRIGDKRLPVKAGDCLGAPSGGEAHQIFNTGNSPLRYIAFSNNGNADVTEDPDSGRTRVDVGLTGFHRTNGTFKHGGKLEPMGYWDGENTGGGK